MFCPNCGKEMSDNAEFCSNCGFKRKQNNIAKGIFVNKPLLVICILLVVLLLLFFVKNLVSNESVSNGWNGDNYYKNGQMIKNDWVEYNGNWYYLGLDGRYVRNYWKEIKNEWYYFDENGAMKSNAWVSSNGNYYYVDSSGKMLKNTKTPDGYYVDENGKYINININVNKETITSNKTISNIKNMKKIGDYSVNDLYEQIEHKQEDGEKKIYNFMDGIDTISFGTYPQTDSTGATKEPIEWYLLDRDETLKQALLISKHVLDYVSYDDSINCTWETSYIRKWLNENFYYKAFSENEREKIVDRLVKNGKSVTEDSFTCGNDTYDNVCLLNAKEVFRYFGNLNVDDYANLDEIEITPEMVEQFQIRMAILGITKTNNYVNSIITNRYGRADGADFGYTLLRDKEQDGNDISCFGGYGKGYGEAPMSGMGSIRPAIWIEYDD